VIALRRLGFSVTDEEKLHPPMLSGIPRPGQ